MALTVSLDVGHAHSLGNDRSVDNSIIPVGGFGLFVQGGSAAVYKGARTAFGTTGELSAQVAFRTVDAGSASRVTNSFALGAALPLNVVLAKQRVFPATSVADPNDPARAFFGLALDRCSGLARKVLGTRPPSVTAAQTATKSTKKAMPSSVRVPAATRSRDRRASGSSMARRVEAGARRRG